MNGHWVSPLRSVFLILREIWRSLGSWLHLSPEDQFIRAARIVRDAPFVNRAIVLGGTLALEYISPQDVNGTTAQNSSGIPPLHLAVAPGETGIVRHLMTLNVDRDAKTRRGRVVDHFVDRNTVSGRDILTILHPGNEEAQTVSEV